MKRSGEMLIGVFLCLAVAGCADEDVAYGNPKQIEDRISADELDSFLRVVEILPDPKLAVFPQVFVAPPQWTTSRTLPVKDLVKEEEKLLQERSGSEALMKHMPHSRFVQRALRREKMSEEHFVALYVAIGMALSREQMPAEFDFEPTLARGSRVVIALKKDVSIFSSLKEDASYTVQEQAAWVSLLNRLQKLRQVPKANVELVGSRRQKLAELFPAEFLRNPLSEFAKVLQDTGVPFDEPLGKESDENIPWSRDHALFGTDKTAPGESAFADPWSKKP